MSMRTPFDAHPAVADTLNSEWAQHGYRSEDDAQQVASLVQDLIEHRKHVALSCRDADTLDHYSRLLVRDLRQRDGVKVVPYFPSSTEVLLGRLNELLAQITIEQAMRRDTSVGGDIHVFVLHDTPSLANAELSLLVQLINDLPGTQLRLVLVLDSDDVEHARLSLLGKRARHWDVPVPAHAAPFTSGRDLRSQAPQVPVLTQELSGREASAPSTARMAPWWQRLTRWGSRTTVGGVAAVCVLMLGVLLARAPMDGAAQTLLSSADTRDGHSVSGRLEPSTVAAPALAPPIWLAARCGGAGAGSTGACGPGLTPS